MKSDAVVCAGIPADIKDRATKILNTMGLAPSDLIRLTFLRVVEKECLPFAVEVSNKATRQAVQEIESGGGDIFVSAEDLFKHLEI